MRPADFLKIGKNSEHLGKKSEFEKVPIIEEVDIMNYTNDIFRKRPILGNRILVPIGLSSPTIPHRVMSHKEAHQVCPNWKFRNEYSFNKKPDNNCETIDLENKGGYQYTMWKCCCVEQPSSEAIIAQAKEWAFNWRG